MSYARVCVLHALQSDVPCADDRVLSLVATGVNVVLDIGCSRMTIGMLIESMAGKAGALHGTFQVTTCIFMYKNVCIYVYWYFTYTSS